MAEAIELQLVTPEEEIATATATMVVVPGVEGDFGAMVQHAPLVSAMRPGVLAVHAADGNVGEYVVTGGFAEVTGAKVTVLADEAFPRDAFTQELQAKRLAAAESAEDAQQVHVWQELARVLG